MDARFYALGRSAPTLTLRGVAFLDVWRKMQIELGSYFDEEPDSFEAGETIWSDGNDSAELVTLNGRVIGAVDRPISQDDLAATWGVDRMEKRAFINRIRSLSSIEGDKLPELGDKARSAFLRAPVEFLLQATEAQSDAIMREVEARQLRKAEAAAPKLSRKAKRKARDAAQREMLLPIAGGKSTAPQVARGTGSPEREAS